ncbi:MAG: metallophosphoesterase [Thermoplasmata archaeon]|nr:metallophosphoesterase [Thermoplasmata archaeon]
MRDHLVAYFESHHLLVESEALQLLLSSPQPLAVSRQVVERTRSEHAFVTREMVEAVLLGSDLARSQAMRTAELSASLARGTRAAALVPYELIREGFSAVVPAQQPLAAYGSLFASRFEQLSRMLRGRPELSGLRPISELRSAEGTAAVIGMIRDVRQTPEKHHLILTVEDEQGAAELLVLKDSPPAQVPYLDDEVVGLRLALPKEKGRIPRVVSVVRPDLPVGRERHRTGSAVRVLFLSDLHIGSRSFMADSWGQMTDFLHERGPRPELAHEIEHVVIAGDLVDGIGIYPNQERDLAIGDVFEQYEELGRRLREIPERLHVVVVPGNHDAVCPAEPQPALPREIRDSLPANVHSIGNPSTFALHSVVIQAYHGRSFDDLIPAIPGASYARPTEVMKRMLAMRHLAPMYGGRTPLAPLGRDGMVIDPGPDILVTGHAHTFGVDQYRGVLLLNASTWQAETEYQRMRNISPVPARAAVVNLADLTLEALDFHGREPVVGGAAT